MSNQPDYYATLGVSNHATAEEIRAAFSTKLNSFGKDIDPANDPDYQRILGAYKVLSDLKRRTLYDTLLAETVPYGLKVDIQATRDRLPLSASSQLIYLLIDVRTPEQEKQSSHPLNLCLVIDRSKSMQGARLDRVIAAVELVLGKLGPEDVLSVISYSDRAEIVVPSGRIENSHVVAAKIRGIQASGGTEIFQGLSAGVREMRKVALAKHTNHLILLTDGHTYGDADYCINLAHEAAEQGITLSAMGIGTEWNDQFLDQLVSPSGGHSMYIETPQEIIAHLRDQIKGLGQIHARNLRFLPNFPASVTLKYGFKMTPFAQPLELHGEEIKLGDIEGQASLTFLLELIVAPLSSETRINVPLNFRADIPSMKTRNRQFNYEFQFLVLANASQSEPAAALTKAVRMLNMYRMSEKVWDEVEAGQLDQAATRMRHLSTRLLEIGEPQLAQQAHSETRRIETMGSLSPEGRKKIKYGTRSLLTKAISMGELSD